MLARGVRVLRIFALFKTALCNLLICGRFIIGSDTETGTSFHLSIAVDGFDISYYDNLQVDDTTRFHNDKEDDKPG